MKFYALLLCSAALLSAADFKTGQAARAVIGQVNFTKQDEIPSERTLGGVSGLAYVNNTLYVVDDNRIGAYPRDNRVLVYTNLSAFIPGATDAIRYDPAVRCPVCIAGASAVLGQSNFLLTGINATTATDSGGNPTGDAAAISNFGLRGPTAIATDGQRLVVADTDNNRVLIWNSLPTTTKQAADLVIGQADFTHNTLNYGGDGHTPSAKGLAGPQGVWIQGNRLFVADTMNNRVLIWNNFPTSNGQPADLVLGQENFSVRIEPDKTQTQVAPTVKNMDTPVSVTSDGTRLFVADLGYNRVLVWNAIPSANAFPADVVLGQPDFTSFIANNTTKLCASGGKDSNGNPTYPGRCASTLNFPRYALSDGKRLFVADGGNDRVLVFNDIDTSPLSNGKAASVVLGQRSDEDLYSSNVDILGNTTELNPDMVGSNALRTPTALAWDGKNLYVSDPYNRRIMVYSEGDPHIADTGVRNAASLAIYAVGTITFAGTITEGDSVTIKVVDKEYAYTIKKDDTIATVIQALTNAINAAPDPNVTARSNTTFNALVLTSKVPGDAGNSIAYSVTTKSAKTDGTPATITVNTSGANLAGGQNAATIAPGTLVTIIGRNFTDKEYFPDPSQSALPRQLGGVEVYFDGVQAALLYVSPNQINTQVPFTVSDATSITAWVRRTDPATGQLRDIANPVGVPIVLQNPGIFALPGLDPRTAIALHESGSATGAVSVDGTIKAGDVATVKISDRSYSYTVTADDKLATVRDQLVAAINADPQVRAEAAGVYTRIRLFARESGTAGEGITYSTSVNNGSGGSLVLTPLGTALCCSSQAGTLITPDNPAKPGETITIFGTGLGLVSDINGNAISVQDGVPYPGPALNSVNSAVDAIAGGKTANVLFAGLNLNSIGVYKLVLQLNSDLPTNDNTQLTIAQDVYVSNIVTFAVKKPE